VIHHRQHSAGRQALRGGLAYLLLPALFLVFPIAAQQEDLKPITRKGLFEALRIGGLETSEFVYHVQRYGVDFRITQEDERELRRLGAAQQLIETIRAHYRPPGSPKQAEAAKPKASLEVAPGPPVSSEQLINLLQIGVPADYTDKLVEVRGVDFVLTPELTRQILEAGGSRSLLGLIAVKQVAVAVPAEPQAPPATAPEPTAPAPPAGLPSGEDIHDLPVKRSQDFDASSPRGRFDIRLHVDDIVDVWIQADKARFQVRKGSRPTDAGSEYSQAVPAKKLLSFRLTKMDGRGTIRLVESPTEKNGYTAWIRISDPRGGQDRYHARLTWEH